MQPYTTTPTDSFDGLERQQGKDFVTLKAKPSNLPVMTDELREEYRQKRLDKIAMWQTLGTRQDWVDERYMRSINRAAGITSPSTYEPASVSRLRQLLRRVGIGGVETTEAVGTSIDGFLKINPKLPLWAALSIVLESTGRWDKEAEKLFEEDAEELAA